MEEVTAMDMSTDEWVVEFLEWTPPDARTGGGAGTGRTSASGGIDAAGAASSEEFVAVYMDWMNPAPTMRAAGSEYRARRADMAGVDVFRDALMAALRTESECLGLLQRVLHTGRMPRRMVKLASRTLRHAEHLLEEERRALRYLQRNDWPRTRLESDAAPEADWPHAIERMAADLSALKGTVRAAQRH
jgi:hypothetical protein